MVDEKINVYETPSCALLEKKSFRIPGVDSFEWCPSKNILAVFILGQHNMPSFITLIEVPSRREIYRKSLFSVKTVRRMSSLSLSSSRSLLTRHPL